MSAFPSLPLFTDAFIADTGHLSAQETGAYLMLMMVAWRSPECRLADDDDRLARWARVDRRTWLRIKSTVLEFWTLEDGFWTQKRLSKEREIVSKRADVARENGKQGGRPKSLNNNDAINPEGSSRVTHEKAPNPNPISNSSLRSEQRARRKPEVSVDPDWKLSEELVTAAENCGLTRADAAAEWPRFIDHALSKDVRHRDWVAAWRKWCRSPFRKPAPNGHGPPGPRLTGATQSAIARAQEGAKRAPTVHLESKPFPARHREPASNPGGREGADPRDEGSSSGGGLAALLDFPRRRTV